MRQLELPCGSWVAQIADCPAEDPWPVALDDGRCRRPLPHVGVTIHSDEACTDTRAVETVGPLHALQFAAEPRHQGDVGDQRPHRLHWGVNDAPHGHLVHFHSDTR